MTIEELSCFVALPSHWNDVEPVSGDCKKVTLKVLEEFGKALLFPCKIRPSIEGGVFLLFRLNDDKEMIIEIYNDLEAVVAKEVGGELQAMPLFSSQEGKELIK